MRGDRKKKYKIETNARMDQTERCKELYLLSSVLLFKCSLTFKTEAFPYYWMLQLFNPSGRGRFIPFNVPFAYRKSRKKANA